MNRKAFQEATVQHALRRLRDPRGSGRFLVADEVGLGKTLVAQGVIDGLRHPERPLNVFYICSSLTIANQNSERLLELLEPDERKVARVPVDRLTLAPKVADSTLRRKKAFNLFTLTPGTMPTKRGSGRADERAVIRYVLRQAVPGLRRRKTVSARLRRNVDPANWIWHKREARRQLSDELSGRFVDRFRRFLAEQLGLARAARQSTLEREILDRIEGDALGCLRSALTLASLDRLRPDLLIFDEFQRFFDMLAPTDDPDADMTAYDIMERILAGPASAGGAAPRVLLLSATPYPPFARWAEGGHRRHQEQLFRLLAFLFRGKIQVLRDLREDFNRYGDLLRTAPIGSTEILEVKRRIEQHLTHVMARTERDIVGDGSYVARPPRYEASPLDPLDIRVFANLSNAARADHRQMAEALWSSIPYPLQMMSDDEYVLRRHARPAALAGPARVGELRLPDVRRYRRLHLPSPRLRALLQDVPPRLLALPWVPPSLPWWKLGGLFRGLDQGSSPVSLGKTLLFARFRAVPRALAGVLSYEAERYAFASTERGRGVNYDYLARRRSKREGDARPVAGLRPQPAASFDFPASTKRDAALRLVPMFLAMPTLARLGDPLRLSRIAKRSVTWEEAKREVRAELIRRLGGTEPRRHPRPVWRWVLTLEQRQPTWSTLVQGWLGWAKDADLRLHRAAARTVRNFAEETSFPREERPCEAEVDELAELALAGPGNVLFRATARVFGWSLAPARVERLTATSVECLRGYLDTPEFHLLFATGAKRHRHPEAVRQVIWDGNLESVLDEYLAHLCGLGVEAPPQGREEQAFDALSIALSIRASSIEVRRIATRKKRFRLRCHAALPLRLARDEVAFGPGRAGAGPRHLRADFVRVAFNSPFRPFVLPTTSIGQEGLDFHVYCDHVVHWDVPWNPVAVEQREGRVRRYASLAVRRALASDVRVPLQPGVSPWVALGREAAQRFTNPKDGGLSPWWVHPATEIKRTVYTPPLSRLRHDMERRLQELALYRLTLGQPDQEALIQALGRRLNEAGRGGQTALSTWLRQAIINLSPYAAITSDAKNYARQNHVPGSLLRQAR
jgi:hypothetical protein